LNCFVSVLFTFPALACDLLIVSLSTAIVIFLMLIYCLYLFPQYALSLRHGYARAQLWNTIKDNTLLVFIAIISLILMLSLALPWVNPKGHTGPTVIEGSCNNRTRCDVSASCNVVSPPLTHAVALHGWSAAALTTTPASAAALYSALQILAEVFALLLCLISPCRGFSDSSLG